MDLVSITLGALASLVIGYLITRYFSQRKSIHYTVDRLEFMDTNNSSVPNKVKISYNGVEVQNLVQWKIGVWNAGNQPIERRDLIEEDPLRVSIKGHKIIDHYAVEPNREVVSPSFEIRDDGNANFNFRILDRGDSFNVVIFSERVSEEEGLVLVAGSISGIPDGAKRRNKPESHTPGEIAAFAGLGLFSLFGAFRVGSETKNGIEVQELSLSNEITELIPTFANYQTELFLVILALQSLLTVILLVLGFAFWGLFFQGWNALPKHVARFFEIESFSLQVGKSLKKGVEAEKKGQGLKET